MPNLVVHERFRFASILAMLGGMFEAYTFVARGGVFANGQTGNFVLFALGLARFNQGKMLKYALPILAFGLGICLAYQLHIYKRLTLLVAALVSFVLFWISYDWVATSLVSFICGLQYQTFSKLHGLGYASIFCTGNTRQALVHWLSGRYHEARLFTGVILAFMVGVVIGAYLGLYVPLFISLSYLVMVIVLNKASY